MYSVHNLDNSKIDNTLLVLLTLMREYQILISVYVDFTKFGINSF